MKNPTGRWLHPIGLREGTHTSAAHTLNEVLSFPPMTDR